MKEPYKLIGVDDERLALKLVERFCDLYGQVRFVAGFQTADSALEFLKENPVDIIVLDIEMTGMNGLTLASLIQPSTRIIFSTAFDQFALEAFDLSATDYLLKPYAYERFVKAIEKAIRFLDFEKGNLSSAAPESLIVSSGYSKTKIDLDKILYVESIDNYVTLYLESNEAVRVRTTLKTIHLDLPAEAFVRIHRSYIVPYSRITSFQKTQVCIGNRKLPLSSSYREDFLSKMASR